MATKAETRNREAQNRRMVIRRWSKEYRNGRSASGVKINEKAAEILIANGVNIEGMTNASLVARAADLLRTAKAKPQSISQSAALKKRLSDNAFYASWEWKRARYEALRMHGHVCLCCGWKPGHTKENFLVVDHIKPRSKSPELELDVGNLQVLCNDCNMGKSNVFTDDFREAWK